MLAALLGIAMQATAVRKWAHRTQRLKGIRFHESKLWRIKKPNEHGLVWRAEAGSVLLNKDPVQKARRS